jgi:hypothetical protein
MLRLVMPPVLVWFWSSIEKHDKADTQVSVVITKDNPCLLCC